MVDGGQVLLREHVAGGRGRVRARDAASAQATLALLGDLAGRGRRIGAPVETPGLAGWAKGTPLVGKARLRHGLRGALLGRTTPREREYANLCWLRARGFSAVEPLACGRLARGGWPAYQLLVTAIEEDARPLEERLPGARPEERAAWWHELAGETARMHAQGFVHRDLFPRNLLVRASGDGQRLVFLDCWAGGPGFSLRGPAYDLACWFLEGADTLAAEEQRVFLGTYLARRAAQGRPAPRGFLRAVARSREGLLRRLRREPARLRGRPMPGPWTPPAGVG